MLNTGENLSISQGDKLLAVERRGIIQNADTIHYELGQVRVHQYQFEITATNIARPGLKAFLLDQYLGKRIPVNLSDTNRIDFAIENAPASYAPDRFKLVFVEHTRPIAQTILSGQKTTAGILLEWKSDEGTAGFDVERSPDGIHFTSIQQFFSPNAPVQQWLDQQPLQGNSYYRIYARNKETRNNYSNSIKFTGITNDASISVHPNPVAGNLVGLQLTGIRAGKFQVRLLNQSGQQVFSGSIQHNGTGAIQKLKLPSIIASGVYKLELSNTEGEVYSERVLVN